MTSSSAPPPPRPELPASPRHVTLRLVATYQVHQPAGLRFANGGMYECRESYQARIVNTKLEPEVNHGHVHQQSAQEEMSVDSS